ncbi:MAG: nucleoside monophosphate kinase [Rickettsia sp.]|nr:nucleoside monophosphate kinase [Rickettsia sp.]
MNKKIIILIGPPGSGKSTQAKFLSRDLLIPHISTGNLLRNIVDSKSEIDVPYKDLIKECLEKGKLIPDDIIANIVNFEYSKENCKKGFILDGYPRNLKQIENCFNVFDKKQIYVLFFEVSFLYLKTRVLCRYYCTNCGFIYNSNFNNPLVKGICDVCRGKNFSSRKDDTETILKKRFDEYVKVSKELINFCMKKVKYLTLNVETNADELYKELYNFINKKF